MLIRGLECSRWYRLVIECYTPQKASSSHLSLSWPFLLLLFLMLAVTVSDSPEQGLSDDSNVLGPVSKYPRLGQCLNSRLIAHGSGCWLSQVKISANSSVSRGSLVIDDTFYLVCTGQKGEAISLISCCKDTHPHPHDIKLRNSQRFHFLRVLDFTMWMQTFWPQQLQ